MCDIEEIQMRKMLMVAVASALLASGLPVVAHEFKVGALRIDHPWSRATPGGTKVGAGYVEITNTGTEPERLTGGSTAAADKFELHTSETVDGIAKMRPATEGIEIPPGSTVALAPGGTHAMLVGLKKPLKEGEKFVVTLIFEKAGKVEVQFKVEGLAYRPEPREPDHTGHGSTP